MEVRISEAIANATPTLSQNNLIVQPTSGEFGHYKTKCLLAGIIVFVVVVVVAAICWKRIMKNMRDSVSFRLVVLTASVIMTIVLSAIASWENIFSQATYEFTTIAHPDWHTIFWATTWALGVSLTIVAAVCTYALKEGEEFRSKRLEKDLGNEVNARTRIERQLQLLTDITTFVMRIVKQKRDRVRGLVGKSVISPTDFVTAIDPVQQIRRLVTVTHEFFMPDKTESNFALRLGIFVRDDADNTRLTKLHSWNGSSDRDCFRDGTSDYLRLDNPYGSQSIVARCFHSEEGCIVVPNYADAKEDHARDCRLLPDGNEKEAMSAVAYKHMYQNTRNQPDAMIIMLLASKADYFKQEEKPEIRQFLDEMLTRLDLEWMIAEAVAKLPR